MLCFVIILLNLVEICLQYVQLLNFSAFLSVRLIHYWFLDFIHDAKA